jgi:hypothetical protein
MFLSDYVADVQEIVHDSTQSSWQLSRVISRINDARQDAARDMQCVRQNVTGIQLLQGQEIYNLNGAVVGATVTSPGSNYGTGTIVPITVSAPNAGAVPFQCVGNLVNGQLSSISVTQWGQGYNYVPTLTVGGIGSGATAVAIPLFRANPLSTVIGNPIVINKISFIWNQQRRQLNYLFFRWFDAFARVWAQTSFQQPPTFFSHINQGLVPQIYIQAPPDQLYLSEWDVIFYPSPLVSVTDVDIDIVPPWDKPVQFAAAAYLKYKHQNLGVVAGLHDKYASYVPHIITTTGGVRIQNPYHRTLQRAVNR